MQNVDVGTAQVVGFTNGDGSHNPHLCEWDGGVLGAMVCSRSLVRSRLGFCSARGGAPLDSSCDERFAILRGMSVAGGCQWQGGCQKRGRRTFGTGGNPRQPPSKKVATAVPELTPTLAA